jgi:hypothetical protein
LGILRGGYMAKLGSETRKQKGKKMMNKDSRLKAKQNVHLQMKSFNSKLIMKMNVDQPRSHILFPICSLEQ